MRIFKSVFVISLVLLVVSCTQKTEVKSGYKIVWEENFKDSTSLEKYWSKIPRGKSDWDNYMSNYNGLYKVENGNLILRGIKNMIIPSDDASYLTGGVYTKDKRTFNHGRIEIKAKLFGARGAWPSIKLLPENADATDGGEIDLMERLNADSYIYQTVHSYYTDKEKIRDNPKSGIAAHIKPDNYNIYAVELYNDSLRFFVNDTHTFTYPRIETDKKGQFPFSENDYYLVLSMQLGGSWVGNVNEQDLPTEIHIDWVRHLEKED